MSLFCVAILLCSSNQPNNLETSAEQSELSSEEEMLVSRTAGGIL